MLSDWRERSKRVHHCCGYPLWTAVVDRFGDRVVLTYRDEARGGLVVFVCPGCEKPLLLWWDAGNRATQQ